MKNDLKSDAESFGEDFTTCSNGLLAALDSVANQEPSKSGLCCFYEQNKPEAFCDGDYRRCQAEIPLVVLSRFPGPALYDNAVML